jgi:hypothetical protein
VWTHYRGQHPRGSLVLHGANDPDKIAVPDKQDALEMPSLEHGVNRRSDRNLPGYPVSFSSYTNEFS